MSLEDTYSDIDPVCPHCDQPASEHEDTECLHLWVASVEGWVNINSGGTRGAMQGEFPPCGDALQRPIKNYTDWQHAGPLLEKMLRQFNLDIICDDDGVALVFPTLLIRGIGAKTIPHAICRGFLHWKANQEAVEES